MRLRKGTGGPGPQVTPRLADPARGCGQPLGEEAAGVSGQQSPVFFVSSFLSPVLQPPLLPFTTPPHCVCPEARPPAPYPQLWLVHKSWTVTRQKDRDESAGCHDNLALAGTQGRGLAVCLSPGIWTTSEHQPGWPRSSQGSPSRARRTMATSPPPWQHLLPGSPPVAPLSCTCYPHRHHTCSPAQAPSSRHSLPIPRPSCLL